MSAENQVQSTAHLQVEATIEPRASGNINYRYFIQAIWMPITLPKARLNSFPEEPRTTKIRSVRIYSSKHAS